MLSNRPTSERRAAAARANGAKSRGPVTAEGKEKSSRNSLGHGLRAKTLFPDPASQAAIHKTAASTMLEFIQEFQPQSALETALLRSLALSHGLQVQLQRLEKDLLKKEMARLRIACPKASRRELELGAFGFQFGTPVFQLMLRHQSLEADRYNRDLDRLLEISERNKKNTNEPQNPLETLALGHLRSPATSREPGNASGPSGHGIYN